LESRRTFLKILVGLGAFVLPWTSLPKSWGDRLEDSLERPSVLFRAPKNYWDDISIPAGILNRKAIEDIRALTAPDLEGRRAGTAGETRALVYLEEQFKSLHLLPFGEKNYWQMFSIPGMEERIINGRALFRPDVSDNFIIPSANILGGIPGKNPQETILISAHYDSLGMYGGMLFPGANDNASGVGCVLEVMRRLVSDALRGKLPEINVVAVFWGAEEMGFLGSKHFVAKPVIPLSDIRALINCDTVAAGDKTDFIIWPGQNISLVRTVEKVANECGVKIEAVSGQGHHSDEISFSETGVPAVTVLSREWLIKNHTSQDDTSLINEDKLDIACNLFCSLVRHLAY